MNKIKIEIDLDLVESVAKVIADGAGKMVQLPSFFGVLPERLVGVARSILSAGREEMNKPREEQKTDEQSEEK